MGAETAGIGGLDPYIFRNVARETYGRVCSYGAPFRSVRYDTPYRVELRGW